MCLNLIHTVTSTILRHILQHCYPPNEPVFFIAQHLQCSASAHNNSVVQTETPFIKWIGSLMISSLRYHSVCMLDKGHIHQCQCHAKRSDSVVAHAIACNNSCKNLPILSASLLQREIILGLT